MSADYLGDSGDLTSTSNTVTQAINRLATTIAVDIDGRLRPRHPVGLHAHQRLGCRRLPFPSGRHRRSERRRHRGWDPPRGDGDGPRRRTNSVLTLSAPATDRSLRHSPSSTIRLGSYVSGHPGVVHGHGDAVLAWDGTPTGKLTWFDHRERRRAGRLCQRRHRPVSTGSGIATCQVPSGQLVTARPRTASERPYAGDGSYSASSQSSIQTITPTASKTYVAGSPMPPLHGTAVHFTASVVPAQTSVVPTGTVQFTFSSAPVALSPCTLTASSTNVTCGGGPSGVLVNEVVSDSTTATLFAGTPSSPSGRHPHVSAAPTASFSGQKLMFTPASSPTVDLRRWE